MTSPNDPIDLILAARSIDLDGLLVRRLLPAPQRRLVGPFIFFDHFGPVTLSPGRGLDVRPHPHIGLATVTYLFDGAIDHRDNLGSFQTIQPGDVNWMVAGKGIVHSERSGAAVRRAGPHLHGLQCWVALPLAAEEAAPRFEHYPHATIPSFERDGVHFDVVIGEAYGARSPVAALSPTFYVHARAAAGTSLSLPDNYAERAVYIIEGTFAVGDQSFTSGAMIFAKPGEPFALRAITAGRLMLLGGAPLDGHRHIWWNFVSSSHARIEQAKRDWADHRFPVVPGDAEERIPLPPEPHPPEHT